MTLRKEVPGHLCVGAGSVAHVTPCVQVHSMQRPGGLWVSSSIASHLIILKLIGVATLAVQQAPGVYLCAPTPAPTLGYGHAYPHMAFTLMLGICTLAPAFTESTHHSHPGGHSPTNVNFYQEMINLGFREFILFGISFCCCCCC